jgi:two-component system repressor protein LuxO
MTIIVVDDEPAIVRMCVQVLQAKGHTVVGYTRADEALAKLRETTADLVVVDYKMPELSGLDFVRRAWGLRPDLRVLMITAHGTREVMKQANEAGVQTIVLKPFTPSELVDGIAAALQDPADGPAAGDG